jgi:nucleoside-diphosphate kinase
MISRFEQAGFDVVALKTVDADRELPEAHYHDLQDEPFYDRLLYYMERDQMVAGILRCVDAIEDVRKIVGDTEPAAAERGTIRGDYAHVTMEHADANDEAVENLVHASASQEEAKREFNICFGEEFR